MARALFISPAKVKRDTALGSTVDEDLLTPYIRIAQDRHIYPALGTDLYEKLESDIIGDSVSGAYQTLLNEYIQPALAQFVFVEVGYVMRLRFANNAVVIANSEVGQAAGTNDIKLVMERTQDIAMFYRQRMIDHLTHNVSSFPEYNSNTGADLHPSSDNYFQGLNVNRTHPVSNQAKAVLSAIGLPRGYR